MEILKIEKIQTHRITFDDGIYCDITPSAEDPNLRTFTYNKVGYDYPYSFAVKEDTIDEMIELAASNAPVYLEELIDSGEYDKHEPAT